MRNTALITFSSCLEAYLSHSRLDIGSNVIQVVIYEDQSGVFDGLKWSPKIIIIKLYNYIFIMWPWSLEINSATWEEGSYYKGIAVKTVTDGIQETREVWAWTGFEPWWLSKLCYC